MIKVIVGGEVLVFEELQDAFDNVPFWSEATMIDTDDKIVYCYDADGSLLHQENL
ncbi:hypothetical protein FDJ20_gp201 [Vibrio phage Thalassa]|uniref:Uncharacterized protein n=1 Tax=Vibrio phage Thalassa TaxID=2570301 RepID=A0A2H5BH26_9CAUD|nr:hypothetical protein FDJ20_gp201 [Vibrio phage Thalassa]AUG85301.1 hypothetical protein THALASSA_106 [Vibrio phage Thalassa]